MAHLSVHRFASLVILLTVTSAKDQGRWSRQISSYTSDISDWVPLSRPVQEPEPQPPQTKRQAVAEPRILTEPLPLRPASFSPEAFPSRAYFSSPSNRQLYLQSVPSVPSAPQNYLTEQGFGQSIRFGLAQPNFPLNQGFLSQQFSYEGIPHLNPRPQPIQQSPQKIKFDSFPRTIPTQLPSTTQSKPFNQPTKLEIPKYIDGYRMENVSNDFTFPRKKPMTLPKVKENFSVVSKPQIHQGLPKVEREEVQLLYVPLESLNQGQFNFRGPMASPQLVKTDLFSQRGKLAAPEMRPIPKPLDNFPSQDFFTSFNTQLNNVDQIPKYSTIATPFPTLPPTTIKPKKLKPHQPPLAIFLTEEANKNNQIKVGDVLSSLKNANSIAVLDSVNPLNAPKVFIGPSSLVPPERYVKFELPYLSNIEQSDKKLRQLPFFVAPLSYNTPQGFAKIPFPSPHVGSVVINSLIKETSHPAPEVRPNYYVGGYTPEQKPATQKPTISFYSTAPTPQSKVPNYQSNYYSFEPQTVSTLRPLNEEFATPPKPGSYFLSNEAAIQYNLPNNYQQQLPPLRQQPPQEQKGIEPAKTYSQTKPEPSTTLRPIPTTPKPPSTYPSQLLETHNPYSINQAFHFSTPLDYHQYEEYKAPVATPNAEMNPPPPPGANTVSTLSPLKPEVVTEKQIYYQQQQVPQQPSLNYQQNYSPEIHYESEKPIPRYPSYNEYTTKAESEETYNPVNNQNEPTISNIQDYDTNQETQTQVQNIETENPTEDTKEPQTVYELENTNQYENTKYESYNSGESKTSTTSTSTTRRTPMRTRGRPRYTTTPRIDSGEYTTRTATRRPLRERRPLPTRSRYEPNKVTSEKPSRRPTESSTSAEFSTKSTRTRNRGRVTFRPSENDEYYDKKTSSTKEQDLAYQRDVLHQNYPVTLMERMSTVDIEAITEPSPKTSPTRNTEPATESYDTENAYTNEKVAVSHYNYEQTNSKEDIQDVPIKTTIAQEYAYISDTSPRNEEYIYSGNPVDSVPNTETTEREEDYAKQTTVQKEEPLYPTEPTIELNDSKGLSYTVSSEYAPREETTTTPDIEVTKVSQEVEEEEENVVQTTPSYNRVRIRPGVIKQYHQASTESTKPKIDRRRPVTYRPAFDRRRTTMRIDEIEADLKTKQVHARPEVQDYNHPVYKPEPSTEAPVPEVTTKRGQFRRRRPTYPVTSTETSVPRKNTYEVKNRFRGRRPTTEKPTDKPDTQTDAPTTTVRPLYSRYSQRPRLSERFNKKPEPQESEDQESNYSINRPKYVEPENGQWSTKINNDSFKPYNPNDIINDQKIVTTERRSDKEMDIITARNDYDEEILLTVTPASNRNNKKIPEIPPTLEALVEQSKVTKSESGDTMSTFESMLEQVMKSLEEQDENEYSSNVMKHEGGEIGEIPPERIISSGDVNSKTTPLQQESETVEATTTAVTTVSNEEENGPKNQRRGFWKKVKVRPVTTESIEVAESQYYTSTVNKLGQQVKQTDPDNVVEDKPKVAATTYKPAFQFIKDMFAIEENPETNTTAAVEITKITPENTTIVKEEEITEKINSPGDLDLGTGSPDFTIDDIYITTEATTTTTEKSNTFSFMDYLFGVTSEDEDESKNDTKIDITTEKPKPTTETTEVSFIPDEITTQEVKKIEESTELPKVSISSFDPANVVSTSMSTEVSHETEICFRGKCIKTSKDIL